MTTDINPGSPSLSITEAGSGGCSCCGTTATVDSADVLAEPRRRTVATDRGMLTNTYLVSGMTCGHCVSAVRAEVGELPGVREVGVDLPTGTISVVSDVPVSLSSVRSAIEKAGYALVEVPPRT